MVKHIYSISVASPLLFFKSILSSPPRPSNTELARQNNLPFLPDLFYTHQFMGVKIKVQTLGEYSEKL